jgi:hypothetical protein
MNYCTGNGGAQLLLCISFGQLHVWHSVWFWRLVN